MSGKDLLHAAGVLLLALLVYGAGIGARDLWDPDEPRYAQVAREALEFHHWLVPHVNGQTYGHKPPLFFWTIAGVAALTGDVDAWSARAPSVLAGALLLALVYVCGVRRLGRRAARFAVALLGTSYLYAVLSTHANIDQLHNLLVTGALLLWFEAHDGDRPRVGWLMAGWTLGGLALLTKGVGLALLVLIAVLGHPVLGRARDARRWVWDGIGLLLALAIGGAWYFPAVAAAGAGYGAEIGVHHTVDRIFNAWSHQRPFYYFLYNFPLGTLPWSLFLPGVVLFVGAEWHGPRARWVRLLTVWCVLVLVFFSISQSKRHIYVLPLSPAWALLTGAWLAELSAWRWTARVPAWILAGALALAGGGALTAPLWWGALPWPEADVRDTVAGLTGPALTAGGILLAGAAALIHAIRCERMDRVVASGAAVSVAMLLLAGLWVMPALNPIRSARPFCDRLSHTVPGSAALASYGAFQEELIFYARRFVTNLESHAESRKQRRAEEQAALAAFLDAPGRGWCVLDAEDADTLCAPGARLEEVWRQRLGGSIHVLAQERE